MASQRHKLWQNNICKMLKELKYSGYEISNICQEKVLEPNVPVNYKLDYFRRIPIIIDKDGTKIYLNVRFDITCRFKHKTFCFEIGTVNYLNRSKIDIEKYYNILYFPYNQLELLNAYEQIKNEIKEYFDETQAMHMAKDISNKEAIESVLKTKNDSSIFIAI